MTTEVKTPLEIAQLELVLIDAGIAQLTASYDSNVESVGKSADIALANYNLQLAGKNNQKAAKEAQITVLQGA